MLSWMLIWMTKQAKSLKAEVEGEIQSAIANSENAEKVVFLLVFIAVLREGFETVLFILSKFQFHRSNRSIKNFTKTDAETEKVKIWQN